MKKLILLALVALILTGCREEKSKKNNGLKLGTYKIVYNRLAYKINIRTDNYTIEEYIYGKQEKQFTGKYSIIKKTKTDKNGLGEVTNKNIYKFLVLHNPAFTTYSTKYYNAIELDNFLDPTDEHYIIELNGKDSYVQVLSGNDYESTFESKGNLIFLIQKNELKTTSLGGVGSNWYTDPETFIWDEENIPKEGVKFATERNRLLKDINSNANISNEKDIKNILDKEVSSKIEDDKDSVENNNNSIEEDTEDHLIIAEIDDPDGYTNVRKEPISTSEIIYKIYEGESFFLLDTSSLWWTVISKNDTGFIHRSRVKITNK